MNCTEAHDRIRAGVTTGDTGLAGHLEACDGCRALAEEEGRLAEALDVEAKPSSDLSFDDVLSAIAEESQMPTRIAETATSTKRWLVVTLAMVLAIGTFLFWRREDFDVYPTIRMAFILGGLAIVALAGLREGTRPLHRPPTRSFTASVLLGALVGIPVLVGLLPPAHAAVEASLVGAVEADFVRHAAACSGIGLLLAAPLVAALHLFRRAPRARMWPTVLGVSAAGAIGNLGLQLHCPIVHPEHILAGHALVVVALALGGAVLVQTGARRTRRETVTDRGASSSRS